MEYKQDDVQTMTGPLVGFIQFMVYTDVNRRQAEPLGEPVWVDMKAMFEKHYFFGSRLSIAIPALSEPIDYTVAMIPFVGYVEHEGYEKKVMRQLVYLVRTEVFPLLDAINPDQIDRSSYPE